MKILFWNINKTPEQASKKEALKALFDDRKPDVFFMAEGNSKFDITSADKDFVEISIKGTSKGTKIRCYVRKNWVLTDSRYYQDGRMAFCKIKSGSDEIGICGLHFWCKANESFNPMYFSSDFRNDISKLCNQHRNLLFIGDFNLNPWDKFMYSHLGFNAIPWGDHVKGAIPIGKGYGTHHFLYNPVWSYLGDTPKSTPFKGTYRTNIEGQMEWQFFDQAVCSKELVDRIPYGNFQVVTNLTLNGNVVDLLETRRNKKGKPINTYSDHYPILCELT